MDRDGEPAHFVLGDAHGRSCARGVVAFVEERLRVRGYSSRRNDPYAGGFVTHHYGRPQEGVHVLQVEIARDLYMDEKRHEKRRGFETLRCDLEWLVAALVDCLVSSPEILARA